MMMKKHAFRLLMLAAALCLLAAAVSPAWAEDGEGSPSFCLSWIRHREENGPAGSAVEYPEFTSGNPARAEWIAAVNQTILDAAHIPEYLQLLSTLQPGGTGLTVSYASSNLSRLNEQGEQGGARYVSLLFSAAGKMLRGRPGQVYYPLTLDLDTGKAVNFDALFKDPDGAKAWIEAYLEAEVEPALSTYLENNQLFPVPYDRFFLDGWGNLTLVYESDQLSFLSGVSGAVSFRYSELWEYLDTSPDGIPMQALQALPGSSFPSAAQYIPQPEGWTFPQLLKTYLDKGKLPGFPPLLIPDLETPMEDVLEKLHAASDSGCYADGVYYEVEEPVLRGAYLLTDQDETCLTGILTSRLDCFGIETGKTALSQAIARLGHEPAALLPMDEAAAEMYLVCPGTVALYTFTDLIGRPFQFSLYADEAGTVQYIGLKLAEK